MSPTEDDLRHALSDGAGDVPDADHIMFNATQQRTHRQKRLLSVAAAVIVVGGVATGIGFLAHHGSTEKAGSAGGVAAAPERAADNGATAATGGSGRACPSTTPSSTSIGGASGTGKLFAKPVSSAVVCAYPSGSAVAPTAGTGAGSSTTPSISLSGSDATTLMNSLDDAATTHADVPCPDIRMADQTTIVVLARAADGTELTPVTTTIDEVACAVVVSNGSALRYAWTPPAALRQDFAQLIPDNATGSGHTTPSAPSGQVNGSPAH